MRRCANCKNLRQATEGYPDHCRAIPPAAYGPLNSAFPVVKADWDCGMHSYSVRRLLKSLVARRAVQDQKG
jgi:hypothetical protein